MVWGSKAHWEKKQQTFLTLFTFHWEAQTGTDSRQEFLGGLVQRGTSPSPNITGSGVVGLQAHRRGLRTSLSKAGERQAFWNLNPPARHSNCKPGLAQAGTGRQSRQKAWAPGGGWFPRLEKLGCNFPLSAGHGGTRAALFCLPSLKPLETAGEEACGWGEPHMECLASMNISMVSIWNMQACLC